LAGFVQSSFIAHTDTVFVVVLAMGTDQLQWPAWLYGAVTAHHVVVTDAFPTSGSVPSVDVLGRALLPRTDSRAMNDDEGYFSHIIVVIRSLGSKFKQKL
jgi:hypothetical protein